MRKLNPNKRIERNNQSTQTLTEDDNVNVSSSSCIAYILCIFAYTRITLGLIAAHTFFDCDIEISGQGLHLLWFHVN